MTSSSVVKPGSGLILPLVIVNTFLGLALMYGLFAILRSSDQAVGFTYSIAAFIVIFNFLVLTIMGSDKSSGQ